MFGNLLSAAASVIPMQNVDLVKFTGREIVAGGKYQNTYADPVTIRASVQAVDARTYKDLGFDATKRYVQVYASETINPPMANGAADRIEYAGATFEAVGVASWVPQDGWTSVYMVEIKT